MAKTLTGVVTSDRPDKTIIVSVATRKTHPIYKKQYTETKKFMAHDENNEAKQGDKVVISETRPLSARKRFTLSKIAERAGVAHVEATPEIVAPKAAKQEAEEAK
jgi:small subunit ribosomal protein S17